MTNIVVSNFANGFKTDRPPFLIDNDAFPIINNAYIWRGRLLKKRGDIQLGRLQRNLTTASLGNSPANATWSFTISSTLVPAITGQSSAQIVPGTVIIAGGPDTFTDQGNGTLRRQDGDLTSTIVYSTGAVVLHRTAATAVAFTITFSYYPALPVMGIEDFNINFNVPGNTNFPVTVFLDTKYSYMYNQTTGVFYDVNFYVGTALPFLWSGQDYQQFWTTNYEGAMWTTNNTPGFNFVTGTYTSGSGTAIITFNFKSGGVNFTTLIVGDKLFFNEWATGGSTINGLVGTVSSAADAVNGNYVVTFSGNQTVAGTGIAQLLTNTIAGQDGIKYFIGDPIGDTTKGWVNFAPPLQNTNTPQYLVGAKIIIPFKNRLLFFGTWTQTSGGQPIYNPNQLVACQNGTVYYANFGLPPNQVADATAFYQNVVGKGLFLNAPFSQEVICVAINGDVLIVIFETKPLNLYSTGDDSAPFLYQTISSEFGAQSTFSAIPLDTGVLSVSPYGYTMTNQASSQRIDVVIPDQVFNINETSNGANRVCAIRDWRNEFVYFTFPTNGNNVGNPSQISWVYPTTTLAFNYRDNLWSTFTQNYTTYGNFRFNSALKWSQITYTWSEWQEPWNFGSDQAKYPLLAAGNQQGFVMYHDESTKEDYSQFIQAISGNTITSPNHCLNNGDYILIGNALGDAGITAINGQIYEINVTGASANTFTLMPAIGQPVPSGTYLGAGTYVRLTNINIQTKQFPTDWGAARQTRIGTQRYLLEQTPAGQITVNLFTSQDNTLPANTTEWSDFLPFSNILLTCLEPNLLNASQGNQDQIWHRISTSVMGDTVQLGFVLSDAQMRDSTANQEEIILYGFALTVYEGPPLAI